MGNNILTTEGAYLSPRNAATKALDMVYPKRPHEKITIPRSHYRKVGEMLILEAEDELRQFDKKYYSGEENDGNSN